MSAIQQKLKPKQKKPGTNALLLCKLHALVTQLD